MTRSSPGEPTVQEQKQVRTTIKPYVKPRKRRRLLLRDDREAGDELKDHELRAKIIEMRTQNGFTPEYIAHKLGVSRKIVLNYIDWAIARFNENLKDATIQRPLGSVLVVPSKATSTKKSKTKKSKKLISPARYEDIKFQREAFYLRRRAVPLAEISDLLSCTELEAERGISLYVRRLNESETTDIEIARRTQVEQIDAAMRAVLPYSTGQDESGNIHRLDFNAIDRLVKLMEAKAKLLGLNTPQRIDIRTRLEVIAEEGEYDLEDLLAIYQDVVKDLPALTTRSRT